ncbi:MAG: diaminopimelate epimerase [Chitinophagales bacterium]|nr:diaminopimelate epimerase [Chitinophagales bacterium]
MKLHFYKYQGTGNDFVIADNREGKIHLSQQQVAFLCHRHFGIGADGLMLLEQETGFDFKMVYYNSDGNESTMCGNGGRCITAFAQLLGVIKDEASFVAIDGPHHATIDKQGIVHLAMQDVHHIAAHADHTILNTGSPHYVTWVDDTETTDVFNTGRSIRNKDNFQPKGINVNFVQVLDGSIKVRTYERGVEDETLSCGTGVTASAIATTKSTTGKFDMAIHTPGGELRVQFNKTEASSATDVILSGPATLVFEGHIELI